MRKADILIGCIETPKQSRLAGAIQDAQLADDAFAAAVHAAGFKSRWDQGATSHPAVVKAYREKLIRDEALHYAFEQSRKTV